MDGPKKEFKKIDLSFSESIDILLPYVREKIGAQIKTVWFIITYLVLFQIFVLSLPIVYSIMISIGVLLVILGLSFFMEGLNIGLMPFGEIIGAVLPKKTKLPIILTFALLLGIGATFAEPAIVILKEAGSRVMPQDAPLLYSLLNDFSNQLVFSVGFGVGIAVLLGVLRFLYGISLKVFIIPTVTTLILLTLYASFNEQLSLIIALSWDCGAVTTGPVTVPLVLALGIGVCRIVKTGNSESSGFGIVTLASLFPILAVLLLGIYHFAVDDYYGRPNYQGKVQKVKTIISDQTTKDIEVNKYTEEEFYKFKTEGTVPDKRFILKFTGGEIFLKDGLIHQEMSTVVYGKGHMDTVNMDNFKYWNPDNNFVKQMIDAIITAIQAIVPLCIFLFITLKFVLKEEIRQMKEILLGMTFAVAGMSIFVLGISLGLAPLGGQLGSNIPATFSTIVPWGLEGYKTPLFEGDTGKFVAALFAFFLGYGATLAEPALNALGATVEKITTGAFKKSLLMKTVATGVGIGISLGIIKMAYNLPLEYFLLPPYIALIALTIISSEEFVNFGWDSAGVTTGPITVPLVLSIGLGIGHNIPEVKNGFGVLSLASVMPIIAVLFVGLVVTKSKRGSKNNTDDQQAGGD